MFFAIYLTSLFFSFLGAVAEILNFDRKFRLILYFLSLAFAIFFIIDRPWGSGRDDLGYDFLFANLSYTSSNPLWALLVRILVFFDVAQLGLLSIVATCFALKALIIFQECRNFNIVLFSYICVLFPLHEFIQFRFAIANLGLLVCFVYALRRRYLMSILGLVFALGFHFQAIFFAPAVLSVTPGGFTFLAAVVVGIALSISVLFFWDGILNSGAYAALLNRLVAYQVFEILNYKNYFFVSPIITIVNILIFSTTLLLRKLQFANANFRFLVVSVLIAAPFFTAEDIFVRLSQMFLLPQIILLEKMNSVFGVLVLAMVSVLYLTKHFYTSPLFAGL